MKQEELQKLLETMGMANITVNGDLVLHKSNNYEINNVEPGGIGIQIISGNEIPNATTNPAKQPSPDSNAPHDDAIAEKKDDEPNYFAPTINIQTLLKKPWFTEFRSDKKYNEKWTDTFVDDLMHSDHKNYIAKAWALQGKLDQKTKLKAYVVGSLREAGVLEGSCLAIAKEYFDVPNDPKNKEAATKANTFSNYMGHCQDTDFHLWVLDYVKYH